MSAYCEACPGGQNGSAGSGGGAGGFSGGAGPSGYQAFLEKRISTLEEMIRQNVEAVKRLEAILAGDGK